ncbi:hypothetical protein C6P45_004864 [Maudiozyma exigua]|uniref:Uncharacterized protein n=1 Tax=Maudiozyma exigua TaxID=34358 RepID=A0A9P6WBD1_MAUEX|nr:hypothetical protein C6P45_004864 [Kazachstania exigua]
MSVLSFVKTHIIGHNLHVTEWTYVDWVTIILAIFKITTFLVLYHFTQLLNMILVALVNSKVVLTYRKMYVNFWSIIPICGEYKMKLFDNIFVFLISSLIPRLQNLITLWELLFNLTVVQQFLQNKENVQIMFTEKSEELKIVQNNIFLTTLIMSNHRSINDYLLIQYILHHKLLSEKEKLSKMNILIEFLYDNDISKYKYLLQIRFISWGTIFRIIQLDIMKEIIMRDENYKITHKDINRFFMQNGNSLAVIFPEVNILTTELAMIQRKIHQDYSPFVSRFYNVLYPRFNTLTEIIRSFKLLQTNDNKTSKRSIFHRKRLSDISDIVTQKIETKFGNTVQNNEINMVVDTDNKISTHSDSTKNIVINQYIYDFTIIYYKISHTDCGHDHNNGDMKINHGIQLEQIVPSLLELLYNNMKNSTDDPIIIMVDIKKHDIRNLLPMRARKLEKWLELQWLRKEELIKQNSDNIRIR